MYDFFNNIMKWVEENPELSIIIGFIIGTVGVVLTIIFGIVPLIQNRRKKVKEKAPAEVSSPDYYKFIWKDAKELTPEDILGLRGKDKYGYREYYYEREFHKELVKRIKGRKDAIVVGMSLSGKTRTVYQALRSLGSGYSVTLMEKLELEKPDLRVPPIKWWRSKKKRILVIDDINNFIGKPNFDTLMKNFMEKGVTVVATCRTGPELAGYKGTELSTYFQKPIEITKLEDEDLKEIENEIEVKPPDGFDWNIGSLFLPLTIMKARYSELNREEKRVLKAINRLHFGGISIQKGVFPLDRVKRYYEEKNSIRIDEGDFKNLLEDLSEKEFLEFGRNMVKVEEAYLDEVIEGGKPSPEDFAEMIQIFIKYPRALFDLGFRAYEIGLFDIRTNDYMKVSITANLSAIKYWTEDNERYKHAMIKVNLGNAYGELAKNEKTYKNLKNSIKAFNEALEIYTFEEFPINNTTIQSNLGLSYWSLSKLEENAKNLNMAVKACEKALKIITLKEFPIYYANTQNNLGNVYCDLAKIGDTSNNLRRAIGAYEEAFKVRTFKGFPIQYAMTQNNLGVAYRYLSTAEKTTEYLRSAIGAFEEALKVYTIKDFPTYYAVTQNNLGNVYTDLSNTEEKDLNLKKAIRTYEEALKVKTKDVFPIDYAVTKINLGNVYYKLVEIGDKEVNCIKSRDAYEEALEIFKKAGVTQYIKVAEENIEELNRICKEEGKKRGGD